MMVEGRSEERAYCTDFVGSCCSSCHEDLDMGYPMCEAGGWPDKRFAVVCCKKASQAILWVEEISEPGVAI